METTSIDFLINNLRSRRDTLALASEALKSESDKYNISIIVLSLATGFFESVKYRLGMDNDQTAMIPIAVASIIACISSLIRFKRFPEQISVLVQAETMLTTTLTNCRNEKQVTPLLLKEYNASLQQLEVSLAPDVRAKFLQKAQLNLIAIMNQEVKYFDLIESIKEDKEEHIAVVAKKVDKKVDKKKVEKDDAIPQVVLSALSEIELTPTDYQNYIVKEEPCKETTEVEGSNV